MGKIILNLHKLEIPHYIFEELNKKDNLKRIIILLEAGVSVEAVTRTIVFSGFMKVHTA